MDWKSLVKTVAPILGTALGGPMAGTAIKFIASSLLGDGNASEAQVADAIMSASPEQLLALKRIDMEFKAKMRELDIDVFKIEAEDRNSARELAKKNMWPQITLSTIYTLGYFAMLYAFMSGDLEIPQALKAEFNTVLGVMTAAQVQIMNFWFGSSHGSKSKD